jgi:hypothetical protein
MFAIGHRTDCVVMACGRDDYTLCAQEFKTLDHLLVECVYRRETWFRILRYFGQQDLTPHVEVSFCEWWLGTRNWFPSFSANGSALWLF